MKITCLINFDEFSGSVTSIIDIFYSLLQYNKNIELLIIYKDIKHILEFKQYFPKNTIFINYTKFKQNSFDILICSCSILKSNFINLKIFKYERLILLDANTIFSMYINQNNKFFDTIYDLKNVLFFGNDCNKKFLDCNKIMYINYLHKFSQQRLYTLAKPVINNCVINVTSETYKNRGIKHLDPHSYFGLFYCRHIYFGKNNIYFENIGKLLFEFLFFKKYVYYSPKNKNFLKDGMSEYLCSVGIDDTYEQELTGIDINPLIFNNTDILLKYI